MVIGTILSGTNYFASLAIRGKAVPANVKFYVNLATLLLFLVMGAYMTVEIVVMRRVPDGLGRFFWLPAFLLITGIAIYFIRRKQSPAEVDSDERDEVIKKRAVLAAFVSVWIVLLTLSVIPRFIVGPDGSIPIWLLPILNVGVFYIVFLVYSVAVLIQYSRQAKGQSS